MEEAGGRGVERNLVLPVAPAAAMIGVEPLFGDKSVAEGDKAAFDVVFVAPDGKQLARDGLRYELLKIESRYQWYRQNSSWEYEPVKSTTRVAARDLTIAADKPSRITLSPQPGRYRLDVKSAEPDGPLTSVQFDVGWYSDGSADTPDLLETSVDKPEYQSGDTMVVSVNVRSAGKLTINVLGDRLLTTQTAYVKEGTSPITIPIGKDWGTGAYVMATLRRPLDATAKRMPGRAIGLKWFGIDKKNRTLNVSLTPPALVRPSTTLKLPVKVGGLNPGEDAKIVVAAVDVGILNLTNYKPPAPDDYYLGQRRMTSEIRDLYGQLIDGMQGTRGQLKTGGDSAGAELQGSPPTQKPLALYSGGAGTAQLDVAISGPSGLTLARHYALDVKAATQILARRSIRTLAKGESLTLTSDMFSDLVQGTGGVSLSVSLSTALDAATILKALDRYPYGCSEQITSRAMPLLYVNDLAAGAHLAMDTEVDQRIKDAIARLLARQRSNGWL